MKLVKRDRQQDIKEVDPLSLTHSSSCKSACKEARLFLPISLPSGGAAWREGEVAARDGEVGCREGERDGEREDGEREDEDGDGVLC